MRNLIYLEECLSTNDEILKLVTKDRLGLHSVYTFHQKKGRGQYGNVWEGSQNLNLAFTIAVPTTSVDLSFPLFNFYTALILRDFVANLTKVRTEIKWPNDLILNGKKIAGILIERVNIEGASYFIIGFGLNVLQMNFLELPNVSSIKIETEEIYNLHDIAQKLHRCLISKIKLKDYLTFKIADYEQYLFRKDKITVFLVNNVRQNGIIENVDENGYLYVNLEEDGNCKFYHKEITMLY